jgi:Domain of unknown function (DUF4062)
VNQESQDDVAIWTPDQRLRVFVSSTLGELAEERRAVARAISTLGQREAVAAVRAQRSAGTRAS